MKFRGTESLGLATFCLLAAGAAGQNASGDPYAPLRLYEGSWEVHVTAPAKKTDKIVNHCAKTGTFFSCEQEVNGKTTALVVFLPTGKTTSGAQEYRMQALQPDASAPQDWSQLVIDGRHMALFVGQQGSWENHTLAKHKSFYRQGSDPF
jgi:hypothetical protein